MPKNQKPTNAQHKRFLETARALECDEDKDRFEEKLGRIARAAHQTQARGKMNTYRLDPIPSTLSNPRWQRSSVRECVWVAAETPNEARKKVALATIEFTPVVPGAPLLHSPWYDDALVICVMDTSRTDVPDDAVMTADGRSLSN
jgi:hypothetical protein